MGERGRQEECRGGFKINGSAERYTKKTEDSNILMDREWGGEEGSNT
jgi:hypothetical protein